MKTPDEIKKFREEILESLATAIQENVSFLQGVVFGLDYPNSETKKEDGFTE